MQTLRLFCDVAAHRSFSQAAKLHGITQSAASQRVGQLEKRLGVQLFDRSVRPLELTAPGREFLRGCTELLERYDELERVVAHNRSAGPTQGLAGQVRVDAIYSAGIDLLNHVKDAFEAHWPRAKVVLEYKRPDEVYEAVRTRQCDLGILSYPQRWRDVMTIPLRTERMVVVCAPDHPLAQRKQVDASALDDWEMVSFEASLPVGRQIRRYLREHGVEPKFTNVFDNIDTIKSAVEVTDQVSILPRRTVMREVEAGTLALVALEPKLERPMGIIYRRSRSNGTFSPAVQAFVDLLRQHDRPEDAAPNSHDEPAGNELAGDKPAGDQPAGNGQLRDRPSRGAKRKGAFTGGASAGARAGH